MGKLTISMAIFNSYVSHYQTVQETQLPMSRLSMEEMSHDNQTAALHPSGFVWKWGTPKSYSLTSCSPIISQTGD